MHCDDATVVMVQVWMIFSARSWLSIVRSQLAQVQGMAKKRQWKNFSSGLIRTFCSESQIRIKNGLQSEPR
jgi:hypothetical protein